MPPRGVGLPAVAASAGLPSLAGEFVDDAHGELGADAIGSSDHRLVAAADGGGELGRVEHRQDGERDAAADALHAGQRAEALALARRAEAEQGHAVLAHLHFGEQHDVAADRADRIEGAGAGEDEIADPGDIEHRAVGSGFGENSGEAGDHRPCVRPERALAKWWAWVMATASASAASGPAMVNAGEQALDHGVDLRLVGIANADDGFLDEPRGIFADLDPRARGDHQAHAARLGELEGRLGVLVDEDFLGRGAVGGVVGEQGFELGREVRQALGEEFLRVGLELAVGKVGQAIALGADEPPAGRATRTGRGRG